MADDIIFDGQMLEEHDLRLTAVLHCLSKACPTMNLNKCKIRLSALIFFWSKLTSDSVQLREEKIAAVQKCVAVSNVTEVCSFLGLMQYCLRFILCLTTLTEPTQYLTRKSVSFIRGSGARQAFMNFKLWILEANTPSNFNVSCPTRIVANTFHMALEQC